MQDISNHLYQDLSVTIFTKTDICFVNMIAYCIVTQTLDLTLAPSTPKKEPTPTGMYS